MAEDTNVEALNEGLNTPVYDDDEPPGYGDDESDEVETANEEPAEETEEEESEAPAKVTQTHDDEDEEPKALSRAQQRFQTLANEKKLAIQRAELLERQLELERQSRQAPPRQQEDENLTELEKWQRQADQTIRQVQFQNQDMQDRSEFLMQVSKNPAEAAYIDRVEQTLMEARKSGLNAKREDVLIRLMGIDARSKLKQAPAVKRDAAQRVSAAKGKPLAGKSNVAATKTASTEYDRLKDIIL